MKSLFTIAALATFTLASAQKTVDLKEFKNITIGADMRITLIKSSQNKLVIESGNNDENELNIDNEGGNLVLNGGEDLTISVYYKNDLTAITAASDSRVYAKDEINAKEFSITAASDAKVEFKVNVQKLNTTAASDANVTLSGKAKEHNMTLASDATLNGKDLINENANAVLSSDASAVITASGTVNATVSSDASLKIYGNPKKVNQVKSGDAEIVVVK